MDDFKPLSDVHLGFVLDFKRPDKPGNPQVEVPWEWLQVIIMQARRANALADAVEAEQLALHKLEKLDVDLDECSAEDRVDALAESVEARAAVTAALAAYRGTEQPKEQPDG